MYRDMIVDHERSALCSQTRVTKSISEKTRHQIQSMSIQDDSQNIDSALSALDAAIAQ